MPWPAESGRPISPARSRLRALVPCDAVSVELPLIVDGSRRPTSAMAEHLRTCLRCQAELAGYRRLLRALRSLREDPVALPTPELVGETLRVIEEHLSGKRRRSPWAIAGALALAGAAIGMAALGTRYPRKPGAVLA
jgi:anti-sigma factor RsiW